jgi:hypothetical protein
MQKGPEVLILIIRIPKLPADYYNFFLSYKN